MDIAQPVYDVTTRHNSQLIFSNIDTPVYDRMSVPKCNKSHIISKVHRHVIFVRFLSRSKPIRLILRVFFFGVCLVQPVIARQAQLDRLHWVIASGALGLAWSRDHSSGLLFRAADAKDPLWRVEVACRGSSDSSMWNAKRYNVSRCTGNLKM